MLDFFRTVFLGFLGIISSVPSYVGYLLNLKTKTIIFSNSRYVFDVDAIKTRTISKSFEGLNSDCTLSLINKQREFTTRGGTLAFNNFVSIIGHDEDACIVEAQIASPDPDKVKPTFSLEDNEISIETKYENNDIRGYVRYSVKVPRTTLLTLIMNNHGNILVESIDNSINKVQSQNGAITIQSIAGDVDAESNNGSVTVKNVTGKTKVKSDNGSVQVTSIKSDVEAQSGNGSIKIRDVIGKARAVSNNGSVTLNEISGDVFASSDNGKVSVTSVEGNVKAQSANGSISLNTIAKNIYAKTNMGSIHHILGKYHTLRNIQAKTDLGSVHYLAKKVKKSFSVTGNGAFNAQFVTEMGSIKIQK